MKGKEYWSNYKLSLTDTSFALMFNKLVHLKINLYALLETPHLQIGILKPLFISDNVQANHLLWYFHCCFYNDALSWETLHFNSYLAQVWTQIKLPLTHTSFQIFELESVLLSLQELWCPTVKKVFLLGKENLKRIKW